MEPKCVISEVFVQNNDLFGDENIFVYRPFLSRLFHVNILLFFPPLPCNSIHLVNTVVASSLDAVLLCVSFFQGKGDILIHSLVF